jgi:hypothetical protein
VPPRHEEPSGAPSSPTGVEPMEEDPSNEAYVLSLLEGYDAVEAKAMDIKPAPNKVDWRDKYIAWMDRGELPSDRSEARRIARMAKSFALVDGELYKRAASGVLQRCVPIPQGRELLRDIHAGVCGHHAVLRTLVAMRSARASTGPPQSPMPARSCAPAKGDSSTPASPTSLRTSCRPSPSHGPSPCGGWTSLGPCERCPGATPTFWSLSTVFQVGRGASHHESQGGAGRDVLHRHRLPLWSAQLHHH